MSLLGARYCARSNFRAEVARHLMLIRGPED
jgi:hypothetical protein